ncbi:uncharacterized protein VTP21DRAFT_8083 [Calcarisporiella thermophila]|uniref:uncharacterized protein n=1 Tax=Calcarisporiella thermophila TaxID=911321 RepID=UPI00374366B8
MKHMRFLLLFLFAFSHLARAAIVVLATNDTFLDRIAAFGPRLTDEGIVARLLPIETLNVSVKGCEPLGFQLEEPWIALVERGECAFIDKVRAMQQSGASAVAVGDNVGNGLITMFATGDTSDVTIPSVFIAKLHYMELKYLGTMQPLMVRLVRDELLEPLIDVLIVVILSPAVMMFFIYALWRLRQQQRRRQELAPARVVFNLPTKVFSREKRKNKEPEECAVCLEDYVDGDELRVMPCKHEFHVSCIDGWLMTRKRTCPICKGDVCEGVTEETPLLV